MNERTQYLIELATYHAERLNRQGDLPTARVSDWIVAETNVRMRAEKRGQTLSSKQLRRRVRNRLAWRGIGKAVKVIAGAFVPAGRPIFNAIENTIEAAIEDGQRRARNELEATSEG